LPANQSCEDRRSLQQGLGEPRPVIAWRPRVWPGGHGQRFFGTINRVSSWVFDLAGARPPGLTAKLI